MLLIIVIVFDVNFNHIMAVPSEETVQKVLCINATYFPDIVDDKISTENFLHASRGVVVIVGK